MRQTWLSERIIELRLAPIDGEPLPGWTPGAHITLHLPNGTSREYSLCEGPAGDSEWTVAVLHEANSRGGSAFVHRDLRVGALLDVDGPRNNFPLEPAEHVTLIAGGIGITPIKAMAEQLSGSGTEWSLLYCGHSRSTMAFLDDLCAIAGDRLSIHCDDERGGPPDLASVLAGRPPGGHVYCCGPEPMLAAVRDVLGDSPELHLERFRAEPAESPDPAEESSFDVVCAGSGTRIAVPQHTSIVEALEAAGVGVPTSCREGICGTCETKVLSGEPEHRDHVLSPAEKESAETILPCVSRCRSAELVLDIS
ncbi:PDR/VanB family oxidoreductase [Prauserella alba]|nr:PDR/VanB family oxidoreductase [Prauserella alba]